MKSRLWVAGLVVASLLLGSVGLAFAAPTVPGAVYSDQQAVGTNKPVAKIMVELQQAGIQDVKPTDWYAGSVTVLVQAGLLKPNDQGQLEPEKEMTKSEGVAVFAKVLGIASKTDTDAQALAKAQEAGLVDERVEATSDMTRIEVARLLAKALGIEPKLVLGPADFPFTDFDEVDSMEDAGILKVLYEMGIFKGYEDKSFRPSGILTKAQIAILIDRILGAV